MKKALVLCFTNLRNDARVRRQIDFLKAGFTVTVVCFEAGEMPGVEVLRVPKKRLTLFRKLRLAFHLVLGRTKHSYALLYGYDQHNELLKQRSLDLIVANDIEALPIAFDIASTNTKVFFDAHEYAPRQFEDRLYWRLFFKRFVTTLCRQFIPKVDGMSTINKGLADEYEKNFGIKPIIVTNAAGYFNLKPHTDLQYPIRLVHHGIFNKSRRPELMIDMMKILDQKKFTLDLYYLISENSSGQTHTLFEEIKNQASALGNVRILPPIKSEDIVETLNSRYDMGIILVPPVNFNYENGLPNKLFDCIQARLGMVVGPLREIASITKQYDIGIVSPDFTAASMASAIEKVSIEDVIRFKQNTQGAAEEMNSEINGQIFMSAVSAIISRP
jgi:hypothetical protein